ncbi:MAG: histidine phosphatase family protein [Bacteroidota bacterium]
MNTDKTVYILRHGQTDFNLKGIVQGGGVDTSLNETGRKQAQAFHNAYADLPFEVVLSSTLKRTRETILPFINQGLPWEQHPEINEMGWGDHEGKKSTPESHQEYKAVINAWGQGNYDAAMPNGETAAQLGERLQQFVQHLRQREEQLILVCSHGRAMRGLMCVLEGTPLSKMNNYSHSNTGLWIAEQITSGFRLKLRNDTTHLLTKENHQWKSIR